MDKEKTNTENQLTDKTLDAFYADTRLTMLDIAPELTAFAILWHSLGYCDDAIRQMNETKAHRLAAPFVIKIIDRLKADGRWPEDTDRQNEYISILISLLMVKSANLTPDKRKALYDIITDNVVTARIF